MSSVWSSTTKPVSSPAQSRTARSTLLSAVLAVRALAIAFATTLVVCFMANNAKASSLSIALTIQQEFYKPLVPVTRNFKTCFKNDPASGIPTLGICTAETPDTSGTSKPTRLPATETTKLKPVP